MKFLSVLCGASIAAAALYASAGFAQNSPPVSVPSKVVGVHFAAWEVDVNIRNIAQDANVIYLFNLRPHPGEVGTWYWEWPGWPSRADVQFVRARGQKVILSLGGAGFPFKFNSRAKTQATLNAIRTHIANNFGPVDGIELNTFEGEENGVKRAALSDPAEILWLIQQLRAEYGSGFALTIPPAPNYPEDLAFATALANNGALTWAAPQFYDWSGFNAPGFISGRMRAWVGAIGQTKCVMGASANYPYGPTLADVTREWDVIEAEFPNIRGAVAWNAQFNHRGGNQWTATMKERVSGAAPPPCGNHAAWNSSTRYMPGDIVTRNGQLYVATPASADPTWNLNSPPEWTPSLWSTYRCTN
ncbi:hypothetical protein ACLESD_08845 [Pyxidicoccus sp. 3LFB2]